MSKRVAPDDFSPRLRAFAGRCVTSVEELEVLMLLRRNATRYWSAEAVASELGMPMPVVRRPLERLASANMLDIRLAQDVMYRFNPAEAHIDAVNELADAYSRARTAVLRLFVDGPPDPIRDFADAFRFKKDRDG